MNGDSVFVDTNVLIYAHDANAGERHRCATPIHDIRSQVYKRFGEATLREPNLIVWLNSFGFKHGIPYGTDLLFDVRFLDNPYFEPQLRELTGLERPVLDFLESHSEFRDFLDR